jgi:hypothetical protein
MILLIIHALVAVAFWLEINPSIPSLSTPPYVDEFGLIPTTVLASLNWLRCTERDEFDFLISIYTTGGGERG